MQPIWWAAGLGVLVLVLIIVGWSVQRGGDGDEVVPDTTNNGQPTVTAAATAATAGPGGLASPPGLSLVAGTPGAGPVSVGGTTIGAVVWTGAVDPATQAPAEPLETIPDDTAEIYAALPLTSIAAGTVIGASWSYNGVPLDALTASVTASTASADIWVAFRLDRVENPATPEPRSEADWPDGEYGVVVTVDGQVVQESTVTVEETFQ